MRADYPKLSFRHNADWERNNILASLLHAEDAMSEGFVCSYADILYRESVVRRLLESPGEIVLAVDTDWRARYSGRSQHPEHDAEKVLVDGDRVRRLARDVDSAAAHGEYIGLAKFGPAGAAALREHYHRDAGSLERAYLIELLQRMIEEGVELRKVDTAGDYFEVDTTEDYRLAQETWR